MTDLTVAAVLLLGAALSTLTFTRLLIPVLRKKGRLGLDLHKAEKVEVVEMGGTAVVACFLLVIVVYHLVLGLRYFWPLVCSVGLLALIGIYDDLYKPRGRIKFLLCTLLVALCFYAFDFHPSSYLTSMVPLLVLPAILALGVSVSANAVNILAGFNGLEAGVTAIAATGVFIVALIDGSSEAAVGSITLVGCCIGFLYYNRYPADVFPGDVGTLTMGGILALSATMAGAEFLLPLLLAPHLVELLCKLNNRFEPKDRTGHAKLGEDGKLVPGDYAAFVHFLMARFPSGERSLVRRVWLIELVLAALSIAAYALLRTSL